MTNGSALHSLLVPFILSTTLLFGSVIPAQAQISVIACKSAKIDTSKFGKAELKEIFTGTKLRWPDGSKIHVVDQLDGEIGEKFYKTVTGKSATQVRKQWTKLALSGQASAPIKCTSDKAVKKLIAGNPNAVGYISTRSLDDSVREIIRIE